MSNVERFESVMAERLGPHAIIKVEGEYAQPAMRLALIAWQASRRAALEEAVRVTAQAQTTSHACDAIRKLAKETNNG